MGTSCPSCHPSCPVPAVLYQLTRFPVPAVLSRLSCTSCPAMAILFQLSCLAVLSLLSCSDCSVCSVSAVMSQLPCPDYPVPAVLSQVKLWHRTGVWLRQGVNESGGCHWIEDVIDVTEWEVINPGASLSQDVIQSGVLCHWYRVV